MFIDIALKAVGIQIIYAAIVVICFTIGEKAGIGHKKDGKEQEEK